MQWRWEHDRSVKVVQLGGDSIPVSTGEVTEGSNRECPRKRGQGRGTWQVYREKRRRWQRRRGIEV